MTQDLSKTLNPEGKDVVEIIIEEHRLVDALGDRYMSEKNMKEKQGQRYRQALALDSPSSSPSSQVCVPLTRMLSPCAAAL